MELRVRARAPGHPSRDLYVEIDAERPVCDLAEALADRCQVEPGPLPLGIYIRRRRAWLEPGQTVRAAQLRQGEDLLLVPQGSGVTDSAPTAAVIVLLVQGGPCAGLRVPLEPGEHQVGRSPECDVLLDDPSVSRVHLLLHVSQEGGVAVRDAGASCGTYHEGRLLTGPFVLRAGQELELGRSLLTFLPRTEDTAPAPDGAGRILFNRPPRVVGRPPQLTFEIEAPPQQSRSAAFSITTALLPLVMGLVMFAVLRQPLILLMTLLAPLMVVGSWTEQRMGGSRRYRQGAERFRERLVQLSQDLARAARAQADHRRTESPDLAGLGLRVQAVTSQLWERRPDDPDFLLMRVGWGDQPSGITVKVAGGGDDALRGETADLAQPYATLRATPLTLSLREAGSLGIAGERAQVLALTRSLLLQTAALHSPEEVMLAAALPARDRSHWRWLGWLPHVRPDAAPLLGSPVVEGRVAARDLLERLLRLVDERSGGSRASYGSGEVQRVPAVVVLLDGDAELPRAGVDRLLERGPACGIHTIWLGRSLQALPGACGAVLELEATTTRLVLPGAATTQEAFASDLAALRLAEEMALDLAPVRDVEAAGQQAEIPRYVSLLDLLELRPDPVEYVSRRWRADDGRLSARLGIAAGGTPCEISLRADGPHALAGGMTGAGKSELLQTLVASLAAAHPPRRLTFILVDYKGGAAFKDCIDLPHTVGFVTDLDGHLVNRALVSLRAELRRREGVLRDAGCKDLVDLELQDPEHAFPSLVIIVDEFAALATDLPEFVDGMVDVAQRGRSLGIHMMLATQRPAGVINDRIRANTNLRLSLRFSDAGESQDVIGTADAARPGLPRGRAFVRSGPGSLMEFQAAHASGRTPAEGGAAPTVVRDLDVSGEIVEEAGGGQTRPGGLTDLQRLVETARQAAAREGLEPPARPWLPMLPEVVSLADLGGRAEAGRPTASIGLLDEPALQRQDVCLFDAEADGGILVYGTSGTGKTTLLRALAAGLASSLPPDRLHVYALDFATRGLRSLEALPHCGGVVAGDQPDRAQRLLTMLGAELERRKALYAATGATTLSEYHAAGGSRLPWILVLLDGYSGFRSTFENVDMGAQLDAFRSLVGEGRPLGMAFAVTADRSGVVPTPVTAAVTRRIVLRMANDEEYSYLGLARSVYQAASLPPGRGFTEQGIEVQCAIPGAEPAGAAQAAAVEALGRELRGRYPEARVPAVRLLPAEVDRDSLPPPDRPMQAVIGLQDGDLSPARVELTEGSLLVAGPRRSGRTTALAAIATSLHRASGGPRLYLLAPRRQSGLPGLALWEEAAVGPEACAGLARRLAAAVRGEGGGDIDLSRGGVVVLDDGEQFLDVDGASELESIAQRGGDLDVRLVAAIETQPAHRAFGGWVAQVQRDRHGFLLDADSTLDGALAGGVRLPQRRGPMPPGRGYLVRAGLVSLVQVAAGREDQPGSPS